MRRRYSSYLRTMVRAATIFLANDPLLARLRLTAWPYLDAVRPYLD
jgi:hypothetical protein